LFSDIKDLTMRICSSASLLFLSLLTISGLTFTGCGGDKDKLPALQESSDPKVKKLKLLPGFKAEHLYSPSENKMGSWVSMAFDDKGRMIVSDQYGSLYRLKIPPISKDTAKPKIEIEKLTIGKPGTPAMDSLKNAVTMGYAQGLLYAFNSLYVMVNHGQDSAFPKGSGLYRLQDSDNDDQFDQITLIKLLNGEGEHGPHSIKLAPDGQSIYLISGNHTDVPEFDVYKLPKTWKEDNLFPLIKDPNGHATDRMAPGGWIARINPEGSKWELVSAGYRNAFDIAFNEDGELFTYDSDMEWDLGMPWYRPTRICHVTSGSEYGWRTGNSKWSPSYPDNLPPVLNIGQGSPTNLVSAQEARFPEKYRRSLLAFDWSFGIIYSVQLKPQGASYTATAEEFISGSPLPLTDGTIGPDGALYFLTGGRRLESDLYRVYYEDNAGANDPLIPSADAEAAAARKTRKDLEAFQNAKDTAAITTAWPYLKSPDRFIRYAARIAIEHQPVQLWQARALAEKDPVALTHAVIALVRNGSPAVKKDVYNALTSIDFKSLNEAQQIDVVRAIELTILRLGQPDAAQKASVIAYLDKEFPAKTNLLNRSLSNVLVNLGSPTAVEKTLALLESAKDDTSYQKTISSSSDLILRNPQYGIDIANTLAKTPPAQQIYYATVLSEAKAGWTPSLQEKYFGWFKNAFGYKGGNSYIGFVNFARKTALAKLPKSELLKYDTLSGSKMLSESGRGLAAASTWPKGPGRNWKLEDALKVVEADSGTRDFAAGKNHFIAMQCGSCHAMKGEGGAVGPDLSQLGTRFSKKDILESIIEPNKVISDQYAAKIFTLKDGNSVVGRLKNEDNDNYFISQNPFAPETVRTVAKKDVVNVKNSEVSLMMRGMINPLNPAELNDLMAYLISGANKDHEAYKPKSK
jgi:putative heme-binding domain-containing protein